MYDSVFDTLSTGTTFMVVKDNEKIAIFNNHEEYDITNCSIIYKGASKIEALKRFILTYDISQYYIGPNIFWDQCAVDLFAHNITRLIKTGANEYMGLSLDRPFVFSPDGGFWGKKNVNKVGNRYNIYFDTPVDISNTNSRINLETVLAVLDEMSRTRYPRETYLDLVGNCMGNEASYGKRLSCSRIEICTGKQNRNMHSPVWNSAYKEAGIRLCFSAKNSRFIDYINRCQGKLTSEYILKYPHMIFEEFWDGDTYYRIP